MEEGSPLQGRRSGKLRQGKEDSGSGGEGLSQGGWRGRRTRLMAGGTWAGGWPRGHWSPAVNSVIKPWVSPPKPSDQTSLGHLGAGGLEG